MEDPTKALAPERANVNPVLTQYPQVLATQRFGDVDIQIIKLDEDPSNLWFTGEDIGLALDLADPKKAVNNIFQRHQEELEEFSSTLKLRVEAGLRETRIYSEEGLYLITMFARSPKAKLFRRWVAQLLKAYREGKLGLTKAAKDRCMTMREERVILKEQRQFWTTAEKIADSIRNGKLSLEAMDSVPILRHTVQQILECNPQRQLTLFPGGAN